MTYSDKKQEEINLEKLTEKLLKIDPSAWMKLENNNDHIQNYMTDLVGLTITLSKYNPAGSPSYSIIICYKKEEIASFRTDVISEGVYGPKESISLYEEISTEVDNYLANMRKMVRTKGIEKLQRFLE